MLQGEQIEKRGEGGKHEIGPLTFPTEHTLPQLHMSTTKRVIFPLEPLLLFEYVFAPKTRMRGNTICPPCHQLLYILKSDTQEKLRHTHILHHLATLSILDL